MRSSECWKTGSQQIGRFSADFWGILVKSQLGCFWWVFGGFLADFGKVAIGVILADLSQTRTSVFEEESAAKIEEKNT